MRRKAIGLFAALLALLLLIVPCTGCLNAHSVDEYGYVLALGVDRGEDSPFYVTLLLQSTGASGEEGGSAQGSILAGAPCASLFEAIDSIEASMPFRLDFSRLATIVCSREAARDGVAAEEFLSISMGRLRVRYYVNLVISEQRAQDYIGGLSSPLAPNIAKLQESYVQYSTATGLAPVTTLAQFYEGAWSKAYDAVLPLGRYDTDRLDAGQLSELGTSKSDPLGALLEEEAGHTDAAMGGLRSVLRGAALFDGTRMSGTLTGEQTQLLLMATGAFEQGRVQLRDPAGRLMSVMLQKKGMPGVTLTLGQTPCARVCITLHATIERPASIANEDRAQLAAAIKRHIETQMQLTYLTCRDQNSDAFGLGKKAAAQFASTADWESYDWKAAYVRTEAVFDVTIVLAHDPTRSRME